MPAVTTNLTGSNAIEQGAEWAHGWAVTYNGDPIDDTWTAKSQVRQYATSTPVLHEFLAAVNPDGSVVIGVAHEESSDFMWTNGVYDVEVTNADESIVLRVAQGKVQVSSEVTR